MEMGDPPPAKTDSASTTQMPEHALPAYAFLGGFKLSQKPLAAPINAVI
jgi:hypothetical protein